MALRTKNHRPLSWNDKRRGRTPEYKYSTVKEISDNAQFSNINVYGIVFDLKVPTQSRGSDFFALIVIVDPTAERPLKIRLFHRDVNYFPKVDYGDIVRIHRLKVYNHMGDVGLASTKGWSWILWKYSEMNNPVMKEISGSLSYTLLKSDEEIVKGLQQWQKEHPNIAEDCSFQKQMTISEIRHDKLCNVYCQIINFEEEDGYCYVRVWDGTKPTIEFQRHRYKQAEESVELDIPDGYSVDVTVCSDHCQDWKRLEIARGSFVLFTGLHSFPNRCPNLNTNEGKSSELILYEGRANRRGVTLAHQNERMETLKSNIAKANSSDEIEETPDTLTLMNQLDEHASHSPKRQRLSENNDVSRSRLQKFFGDQNAAELQGSNTTEVPGTPSSENSESVTVIAREYLLHEISTLKAVMEEELSLSKSKLFRVKCRILSVNTSTNGWVGHYSPNTSLFFPSKNLGTHLKITKDLKKFLKAWRRASGKDENPGSETLDDTDPPPSSQWQIPFPDGSTTAMESESYINSKDGSRWKSMKSEPFLIRKRKLESDEFSILYILQSKDFSPGELSSYKEKYNRVLRILPLGVLTSDAPPAVGIQDDVFYYCCPANAKLPVIPSLKEEANCFQRSRIANVAGCPVLVPRFDMALSVQDDSGVTMSLSVSGKNANDFWGITPQVYLGDVHRWSSMLKTTIDGLVQNQDAVDCIVEKKSRRTVSDPKRHVASYEVRHTSLKTQMIQNQ